MNKRPALMPVDEAVRRVVAGIAPVESEEVALADAFGRVLAAPLVARRSQPPFDASAMDGYAVRAADTAAGRPIAVIGRSIAGQGFSGRVGPGQAARIFTGAPVPDGADTILIQEDAEVSGQQIVAREVMAAGRHIRRAGLDFKTGDSLLARGQRIGLREVALAAAVNQTGLPVFRRPRVALIATGDELVPPGAAPGPDQIIASTSVALAPYFRSLGAEARDLGIVPDDAAATAAAIRQAVHDFRADVLVTIGGASVGDHDLVRGTLAAEGMALDFWQIAMRPGKPLIFGRLNTCRVLGLPGNPVSSLVCALLFARPLIAALLGAAPASAADPGEPARLGIDLPANDHRQDYMRATLAGDGDGPVATPLARQDSSMLSALATADCLLVRPPNAPAASAGDPCRIIRLP